MTMLGPSYSHWRPDDILAYFRQRTGVNYFPVLDDEHSTREKIDGVLVHRFDFNGEVYQLPAGFDWTTNPSRDLEWLIVLHKFYYAVGLGKAFAETGDERYAAQWIALISAWIDTVPLGFLPSDVAGRRIQNWIFAHYYFVTCDPQVPIPPAFYCKFLTSLAAQVNYLCTHLTPARNHRTLELYAIFLAAVVFPEFRDAAQWLTLAKAELVKNICTDILPDGVHCELSTDYHHLVLKNYLGIRQLAHLNHIDLGHDLDVRIQKALEFAMYVHKPDGCIPALSDGDSRSFLDLLDQGYTLYRDEALRYVATQGRDGTPPASRSKAFPAGGYYIMRSGWGDGEEPFVQARYLVFDCGPLGQGNHGHLDLLSVEMAAYGQSLIVDPGRYTYDESGNASDATNWRSRFRGTAYHNTVQVDQKNQTRYEFHKTRCKIRGPEPDWELKQWQSGPGFDYVHGVARSHEYEALHERAIFFACPDYWIVSDILHAQDMHEYDLRFHLSEQADTKVTAARQQDTLVVDAPHLVLAQAYNRNVRLVIESGYVSRTYGIKHRAPVVRFRQRARQTLFQTVLYPYQSIRPQITVESIPVYHDGRVCAPPLASALYITFSENEQWFQDIFFRATPVGDGPYTFAEFMYTGTLLFVRQDVNGHLVRLHGDVETALTAV